jgi:hypothetical protein
MWTIWKLRANSLVFAAATPKPTATDYPRCSAHCTSAPLA